MNWLNAPLATIAYCWRIERRDGVAIGLTAHDRDLEVDGFRYRAAPGMTPSAIRRTAGLDADSMDATGALTGAAISETDLIAGRWDGARITLFAVDWSDPGEIVALGSGTIGAVETRDGTLTAELRGVGAALDAPVVEMTSPECRAELGDKRCRVAMAGRRRFARVIAADGAQLTLDAAEPVTGGWTGGRLRWIGGANSGLSDVIAASAGGRGDAAPSATLRCGRCISGGQRGMRQEHRDLCGPVRQCGEFSRRAIFARDRPVDPLSGGMSPLDRARGAIGVRFRLHGRSVAFGLDCVGLAGLAYGIAVPRGYALRGGSVAQICAIAQAAGLGRVADARPGDLLLLNVGAGQLHLAIASEGGVIHADAGLRRVVERPGVPPWPELARWRRGE